VDRLQSADDIRGTVLGFLVLSGVVTLELSVLGRSCVRLIAPRDLILLDGLPTQALPMDWGWSARVPTVVTVFDDRLLVIGQRWPRLLSAVLERAAHQTRQTLLQQAISQLPRVEDRLRALFWVIAERQGVVRSDGVFVPLEITHEVIAQMIGGRRPTVSLGLTRLAEQGLMRATDGGWLLHPDSREDLLFDDAGSLDAASAG
jgi:CRP-like cAMP-binding protein